MKFRINLASEPYENARRFYVRWGALLLAMAIVTGALVLGAVSGWRNAHGLSGKIAAEKTNLDKLNRQEQQDIAILNKPENRDVRDKSRVLNGLIRSKEFSWTLIFSDLERLMPTRLHVISIAPQLDQNNDIEVHMVVAGDSRDKAIELIQNMEKSREFRRAQVLSESETRRDQPGTQAGDTVQFEITAQYVPVAPAAAAVQEGSGQ
jgi:type IV pilus assembly protein PilN